MVEKKGRFQPQQAPKRTGSLTATGHTLSTVLTSAKYVGCFQDNVYQDPSHLYNNSTKKCLHFNHFDSFTSCQLWKKVNELTLFSITLVWFHDDGPLWTEQCRNIQCGIILYDLRSKHFVGLVSWIIYLQIFPLTFGKLQVKPVIQKENTIMRDLHDIAYSTKIFKPSWLCKTHIKLLCNNSSHCSHYSLCHTNCLTVSGLPQIKELTIITIWERTWKCTEALRTMSSLMIAIMTVVIHLSWMQTEAHRSVCT
jgi:hypothetical protein